MKLNSLCSRVAVLMTEDQGLPAARDESHTHTSSLTGQEREGPLWCYCRVYPPLRSDGGSETANRHVEVTTAVGKEEAWLEADWNKELLRCLNSWEAGRKECSLTVPIVSSSNIPDHAEYAEQRRKGHILTSLMSLVTVCTTLVSESYSKGLKGAL